MTRRNKPMRRAAPALSILCAVAIALALRTPPASAQSSVTVGGPFTLIAADGTTVTDRTYRGKWLLVYFGFTSCPNTCPMALFEIAGALARLGHDADDLQPLFITVDPRRDTPAVLRDYTESFDPRIIGLTGTPQ